jgi:D-lyxose ketol-isomerase
MKRSEINRAIERALRMLDENGLCLPEFAYWTMEEWQKNAPLLGNLRDVMLGWDVTDFGSGDFVHCGAVLFTIRNGKKGDPKAGTPYAEKLIFQIGETAQEIPFHYHTEKTEDIINRGGGTLALELYCATPGGGLDRKRDVTVRMDGIWRTARPGEIVEVAKGRSITLTPGLLHRFWAKQGCGDLVVGEVSSVNDDTKDNTFLMETPRFAAIEEDEPASRPLCNEYAKFLAASLSKCSK